MRSARADGNDARGSFGVTMSPDVIFSGRVEYSFVAVWGIFTGRQHSLNIEAHKIESNSNLPWRP